MNNRTEQALIIRSYMDTYGYKLIGLAEMKLVDQKALLQYIRNNEFITSDMVGIAKFLGCTLYKKLGEE